MAIQFKKNLALLTDTVSVEDAENLLSWCQQHQHGKIDLSDCSHVHSASLQVLMASRRSVIHWPRDADLKLWLQRALSH